MPQGAQGTVWRSETEAQVEARSGAHGLNPETASHVRSKERDQGRRPRRGTVSPASWTETSSGAGRHAWGRRVEAKDGVCLWSPKVHTGHRRHSTAQDEGRREGSRVEAAGGGLGTKVPGGHRQESKAASRAWAPGRDPWPDVTGQKWVGDKGHFRAGHGVGVEVRGHARVQGWLSGGHQRRGLRLEATGCGRGRVGSQCHPHWEPGLEPLPGGPGRSVPRAPAAEGFSVSS